jgi:hypothetical protein
MADRPERNLFELRRPLHRGRRTELEGLPRPVHVESGDQRAEMKRRRHVVRDVHRAQLFVLRQVAVRAVDHALALVFGQLDARQLQRFGHHRERDLLGAGVLHPRPHDPGRQGAAQADAREVRKESAACLVRLDHLGYLEAEV